MMALSVTIICLGFPGLSLIYNDQDLRVTCEFIDEQKMLIPHSIFLPEHSVHTCAGIEFESHGIRWPILTFTREYF